MYKSNKLPGKRVQMRPHVQILALFQGPREQESADLIRASMRQAADKRMNRMVGRQGVSNTAAPNVPLSATASRRGIENSSNPTEQDQPETPRHLEFPATRRGERVGCGTHPPRSFIENSRTAAPAQKCKARRLAPPGRNIDVDVAAC